MPQFHRATWPGEPGMDTLRLAAAITWSWRAALVALVLSAPLAVSGAPEASSHPGDARTWNRRLFGHEMLAMPPDGGATSRSQIEERLARGRRHGIDVFELFHPEAHPDMAARYYKAAQKVGAKVCLSFGYIGSDLVPKAIKLVRLYADHPAQYKVDGKPYVTAYHGSGEMRQVVEAVPGGVHYVPHMFARGSNGGALEQPQPGTLERLLESHPWIDGLASFYPLDDWRRVQTQYLEAFRTAGKGREFRMSITPRHESTPHKGNWRVFEGNGFEALREQGLFAVEHRDEIADLTLVTLNDYSEGTDMLGQRRAEDVLVRNSYWNTADWPAYVARDGSLSFFSRYAEWFRTGREPPIEKLELWISYRLQGKDVPGAGTPNGKPGEWQKFNDAIFVAVRAVKETTISVNGESQTVACGEHHLRFAHQPGPVRIAWPGGSRSLPAIVETATPGAWHSLNLQLVPSPAGDN
ncbi:MAG TPA: endo-1,3-alpha-glucanase family glycosylhydrolase [Opitutaceae bacterium]